MDLYFSDIFGVSEVTLEEYGAFNISLITDLPLFIDPFLLFTSSKAEYRQLHDDIIAYLRFLRRKSEEGGLNAGLIKAWYRFAEVKQNWLGFCVTGNRGRGLGLDFATALDQNLVQVFGDFGQERITRGSHLEKLCLIRSGVGRDMISDFSTNLVKHYLLGFTERFARVHIAERRRKSFGVQRARFDYELEQWCSQTFELPAHNGDYVLLTPRDILTKDDTWINHGDMIDRFEEIPNAIENEELRAKVDAYFRKQLGLQGGTQEIRRERRYRKNVASIPSGHRLLH